MNRLQHWNQLPENSISHDNQIDQALLTTTSQRVPHALFAPLHYEPNYAYPLIVWLHGPRDGEQQLQRVAPEISMRNYVAVGPRGPVESSPGYTWSGADVESAERLVFECVDIACSKFHIATQRVFLAGYEGGGSAALRIGLKHPSSFAGVLSLGGPFPLGQMPLARLHQSRQLPLFIATGRDSQSYPVERTCAELRLFHAAGLSVTMRQYPCGDELNTQMLRDVDAWMMELVTGVPNNSDSQSRSSDFEPLN